VLEVRDPARQAWLRWTREEHLPEPRRSRHREVETWWDVTEVDGAPGEYRRTYVFAADGTTLTSDFHPAVLVAGRDRGLAPLGPVTRWPTCATRPTARAWEWVFIARKPVQ